MKTDALRLRVRLAEPLEIDIVDRPLRAIAVDEVDVQATDAFNGRDLELVGAHFRLYGLGTHRERALIGIFRVGDPEGHGWSGRAVLGGKTLGEGAGMRID